MDLKVPHFHFSLGNFGRMWFDFVTEKRRYSFLETNSILERSGLTPFEEGVYAEFVSRCLAISFAVVACL